MKPALPPQAQPQQLNVKIDEQVGEGIYANFFAITGNVSEFVMDFGRITPGMPSVKIFSRIISTPQHTKQFLQVLQKNLEAWEEKNGEIVLPGQEAEKSIGFK